MTRDGVPTVLIVDDDLDMRLLVRMILQAASRGIEIVGEAADGLDAMSVYWTLDPPEIPDVVILDNRMPGPQGIEVAAEMLRAEPRQHIVLFTAFINPELEERARNLGIDACISKSDADLLPDLVLRLATGGSPSDN